MIKLTKKTEQDFLGRSECKRLIDAGIDMSDAKYGIVEILGQDWVVERGESQIETPTYTLSEILYKLDEYPYLKADGVELGGALSFVKDAPFYIWYYPLKSQEGEQKRTIEYSHEYPIVSAARLLEFAAKNGMGYVKDISDK